MDFVSPAAARATGEARMLRELCSQAVGRQGKGVELGKLHKTLTRNSRANRVSNYKVFELTIKKKKMHHTTKQCAVLLPARASSPGSSQLYEPP